MEKQDRTVQYLIALSVSTASLTMGICSSWSTPVLPKLKHNETSIHIDKDQIAWMLSMGAPGFIAGSLLTGFLIDRIGRRATMLWSAVPYGVAMIIVASAQIFWLLYVTQFLWQVGTGMLSNVMTLYFAEISDKDIRGTISLLTRIAFNFGSLLMMCIGPFLTYEALNQSLLVLPILFLVVCWWIPESPYYYLKDGRSEAAKNSLKKLRGYQNEIALDEDLHQMKCQVKNEMRRSSSPKELFTGRQYQKAIIIATGLKVTQIMTGGQTISQYLALIMQESAMTNYLKLPTILIIFGAVRFVVSIMPSVLADKVGRRPLLIYSYLGTAVSLAVVGVYFFLMDVIGIDKDKITPYGGIVFAGIIASNIISTIGFNSIVTLISAEIFPMNVKASALTSLSIFGGVLSFIIARSYQALKDVTGLCGVFWVFAAVALSGAVFCVFLVPETKGICLKEIQVRLQGELYICDEDIRLRTLENGNGILKESEGRELEVLNKKETNIA